MKPRFAIRFTDDGLALLHREGQGWAEIATTVFDRPDLDDAMQWFRTSALEIAPEGFTTLLVLPESQILYTRVHAPAPVEAARREQIIAALEGRTPYDVADLAFDWIGDGDEAQVAVIARETLDEAESFATAHGMNPVGFAGAPSDHFAGVPFFGPTGAAETLIGPGETVEPEDAPLALMPFDVANEADAAADDAPDAEPEPDSPRETPDAPQTPDAPDLPDEQPPEQPPEQPTEQPTEAPVEQPDEPALPEPPIETPDEVPPPPDEPVREPEPLPIPVREPEPVREPTPDEVPEPDPLPDDVPEPYSDPVELPGFDPMPEPVTMLEPAQVEPTPEMAVAGNSGRAPILDPVLDPVLAEADEAPMALDVPLEPEAQPFATKGPSVISAESLPLDDIPSAPSAAASLAFASRRAVAASVSGAAPRPLGAASKTAIGDRPAPISARAVERPAGLRPSAKLGYADPVQPTPLKEAGSRALRGLGALVTSPSVTGLKRAKVMIAPATAAAQVPPAPATATAVASAGAPATATTPPPAKRPAGKMRDFTPRPAAQRGKPRHLGLILTGILLLMLAVAAALSSIYLAQDDTAPSETELALAAAAPEVALEPAQDLPDGDAEVLADGSEAPTPTALMDTASTDTAQADPATLPVQDTAPDVAPDVALANAEPAPAEDAPAPVVASAATVSGQPDVPAPDEITLSAADSAPDAARSLALPVPEARGDPLPNAQTVAPPFGTVYQFDADGLIRPTPEGIVTPEGVLLVAGKPARLPPARPEGLVPVPVAAPVAVAPTEPAAAAFPADPALAGARPRLRPAGLAPVEAAPAPTDEQTTTLDEQAALIPVSAVTASSPRPAARPASILTAGLEAQQAAVASASLVAPDPNRSILALSVSRRPAARPANMARAVEAAVAAAARQPDPEPVIAAAPPPPEDIEIEDEPELVAAAPAIPSTANVAKQATVRNAINLSKLNLIGVYGSQSNRYALVRQPNGRYVKVTVGDRLDGGRVAAITASEVRYEKRGRMLILEMPRG